MYPYFFFFFCLFCYPCIFVSGTINLLPAEVIRDSEINHIFWILCIRHFIVDCITFSVGYDSDVIHNTFCLECTDD